MIKKRGWIVLVLALFLLIIQFSQSPAEVGGCYVYPKASADLYCQGGILDTEAKVDCDSKTGCNMKEHFLPGSDCSELTVCEEVTCSIDCQSHPQGKCEQLGGTKVNEEDYSLYCNPGCCKIADKFCQFNLLKAQCDDKAKKLGLSDPLQIIFDNKLGMNTDQCNNLYCKVQLEKVELTVLVQDSAALPIPEAQILLQGTTFSGATDNSGKYLFTNLNPGTYSISVSAPDYSPASAVISISPGEKLEQTFTLTKLEGIGEIKGTVTDSAKALAQVTISWSGPVSGQILSNDLGEYSIPSLPKGNYLLTASKIGYTSVTKPFPLTAAGSFPLYFTLTPAAAQSISGTVYLDSNHNLLLDPEDKSVFGANLYLDGVFKGNSQFPGGTFSLMVASGTYKVTVTYSDYNFEQTITLAEGQSLENQKFLLTSYLGECTEPGTEKAVEIFSAKPVPGEKVIKLEWSKPCPEVTGYLIEKYAGEIKLDDLLASPAENSLSDPEVDWGKDYTYKIIAYYDKGRIAVNENSLTLNVGDKRCAGHYHTDTNIWDSFCLIGDIETKQRTWTCNNDNQLQYVLECEGAYYCSEITATEAICANAGGCGLSAQQADPFGLYYSRAKCYGTPTPEDGVANFCYFDFTDTIVNQCKDCTKIDSCFNYKSKDACEINSCLGSECQWVDSGSNAQQLVDYSLINLPVLVTAETGAGYCVEKDYDSDQFCSLCGPSNPPSSLFENYYCTAEVCSGLGRCFSAFNLDLCSSCGEFPTETSNCYAYNTEMECTAQQNVGKNVYEEISPSQDRCGWEKCLWTGTSTGFSKNTCVKDANADSFSDCEIFVNPSEQQACKLDHSAPKTQLQNSGIGVISFLTPEIVFNGNDGYHTLGSQKNSLKELSYCLTSPEIDQCFVKDGISPYQKIDYSGKGLTESISVNLITSTFLEGKNIPGETHLLKFYSMDKYFNQENPQKTFVYIDNVLPDFEINEDIQTQGDTTALSVYLTGTKEIISCDFTLNQILPAGSSSSVSVPREEQVKTVFFQNLKGIKYTLNVTCTDDAGNQNSKPEEYIFDLEKKIEITSPKPKEILSQTEISFQANTIAGASCALYLSSTNQKVADFLSDETGKVHTSPAIPGFYEKTYAGEYKIVCSELLNPEITYEDYYDFQIDFTPPQTQIYLKEGIREEQPKEYGWQEYFIQTVNVTFECSAEGFECDKTYYCLGEGCEVINNPNYAEYTATLELTASNKICYYSIDLGNSPVYQPLCGTVKVEGYGITLEKPEAYTYQEEIWGFSHLPNFDFQFFTKVPTQECKFDFVSGYDYENIPPHKAKTINTERKYLFSAFPESVFSSYPESCADTSSEECIKTLFVKCQDLDGIVGPEQKIYLEYDPSAPKILDAYAQPDPVLEGVSTELFTVTDDKTICRYSDASEGAGSQEYANMEYSFPGTAEKVLDTFHQATFALNFLGATKDYTLFSQCQNGAGDLSEPAEIFFSVDYSQLGYIVEGSLFPGGYIFDKEITLYAETSKNAYCSYDLGDGYLSFTDGQGEKLHSVLVSSLEEGDYLIPVKCVMGDHLAYGEIKFKIDLTAPTISKVEDGNRTCGSEYLNIMVYTDDLNVTKYIYEIYSAGKVKEQKLNYSKSGNLSNPTLGLSKNNQSLNQSPASPPTLPGLELAPGTLMLSGEVGPGLPLLIPTNNLTLNNTYKIKVKATDAAGNVGKFIESDGVALVESNYSLCLIDNTAPEVTFSINDSSCTLTSVEMFCTDNSGCKKVFYGKQGTSDLCQANETYQGKKINLDKSGWLCYYVEDYNGNNHTDKKKIGFSDADGDGIKDSCDNCTLTTASKIVNKEGCADGEVSSAGKKTDTDGDGLPDSWEKNYDAEKCALNYASPDSDDNGVADNFEDYDQDGYNNHEEYLYNSNPCLADAAGKEKDKFKEGLEKQKQEKEKEAGLIPPDAEPNYLAWIFLLLGLLLMGASSGYLIYYYSYSPLGRAGPGKPGFGPASSRTAPSAKPGIVDEWKQKLFQLRKAKEEKQKLTRRKELFGEFGKSSLKIPHIAEILSQKAPHLDKLQDLAQTYTEHKDEIKPGLRAEEKGIFNRLESIAKKSTDKDIKDVVDVEEAKDIFSQLKDLSKKRKK